MPLNVEKTKKFEVREEHLATFLGSGNVEVLSTPQMIAWMENVSRLLIDEYLPEGYTTVGYHVDVYHLKPAPKGSTVEVHAKVVSQKGRKITLEVSAKLGEIVVGKGIHERYIIDLDRFREKTRSLSK